MSIEYGDETVTLVEIDQPFCLETYSVAPCVAALGTTGTRILQLAVQFFDFPPEFREEIMDIFDSVEGQSRLSAYQTVRRFDPEYHARIRQWSPRIGGGSLVTTSAADRCRRFPATPTAP